MRKALIWCQHQISITWMHRIENCFQNTAVLSSQTLEGGSLLLSTKLRGYTRVGMPRSTSWMGVRWQSVGQVNGTLLSVTIWVLMYYSMKPTRCSHGRCGSLLLICAWPWTRYHWRNSLILPEFEYWIFRIKPWQLVCKKLRTYNADFTSYHYC